MNWLLLDSTDPLVWMGSDPSQTLQANLVSPVVPGEGLRPEGQRSCAWTSEQVAEPGWVPGVASNGGLGSTAQASAQGAL